MTITEFLLARFAEDEAEARKANWGPRWTMEHDLPNTQPDIRSHIIKWSPARVLAECEAKRRIVARHEDNGTGQHRRAWGEWTDGPCDDLRALALPYADHPDCREEWKP